MAGRIAGPVMLEMIGLQAYRGSCTKIIPYWLLWFNQSLLALSFITITSMGWQNSQYSSMRSMPGRGNVVCETIPYFPTKTTPYIWSKRNIQSKAVLLLLISRCKEAKHDTGQMLMLIMRYLPRLIGHTYTGISFPYTFISFLISLFIITAITSFVLPSAFGLES